MTVLLIVLVLKIIPPGPGARDTLKFTQYCCWLNDTCAVMALLDSRSLVQSNGRTLAEGDPEGILKGKTQRH